MTGTDLDEWLKKAKIKIPSLATKLGISAEAVRQQVKRGDKEIGDSFMHKMLKAGFDIGKPAVTQEDINQAILEALKEQREILQKLYDQIQADRKQ